MKVFAFFSSIINVALIVAIIVLFVKLDDAQTDIYYLEDQVELNNKNIWTNYGSIKHHREEIDQLNSDLVNLESNVNDLEGDVSDLERKVYRGW